MPNDVQLALIAEVVATLARKRVDLWLRGGWALDFLLGDVTREHDDIDFVAWLCDAEPISEALEPLGYQRAPLPNDRPEHGLRLTKDGEEVAFVFIERGPDGALVTRDYERWPWSESTIEGPWRCLRGVACRVMSPDSLLDEKERYVEWSGRLPRPKDLHSMELLREIVGR